MAKHIFSICYLRSSASFVAAKLAVKSPQMVHGCASSCKLNIAGSGHLMTISILGRLIAVFVNFENMPDCESLGIICYDPAKNILKIL